MRPVDSLRKRIAALAGRVARLKKKDVATFVLSFLAFFILSSVAQVAFSPGTETSFDSSSIDNRETAVVA